jgi:excisionase family DNA binding protein
VIPSRDMLLSPQELAETLALSKDTLADWRSQKRGPAYYSVGRKIWYPKDRVAQWFTSKLKETRDDGYQEAQREVALSVQTRRPKLQRSNRLGRHSTKRERGETA